MQSGAKRLEAYENKEKPSDHAKLYSKDRWEDKNSGKKLFCCFKCRTVGLHTMDRCPQFKQDFAWDSTAATDSLQFLRCCRASQTTSTCDISGKCVPAICDIELIGDSSSSNSLIITGVFGGKKVRVLCDTGATASFIHEKHLNDMKSAGADVSVTKVPDWP